MPLIVIAAFPNRLDPSIGYTRCFTRLWPCSIRLLSYLLVRAQRMMIAESEWRPLNRDGEPEAVVLNPVIMHTVYLMHQNLSKHILIGGLMSA